jgi:hypothetical protein
MKRATFAIVACLCIVLTGCLQTPLGTFGNTSSDSDSRAFANGTHAPDYAHFYFLPPLTRIPRLKGEFDANQSPIVEIVASGSNTVIETFMTVHAAGRHYRVNWRTKRYRLDKSSPYRINVYVPDGEARVLLGYTDVAFFRSARERRTMDPNEFVRLKYGRALPIKFRIEHDTDPSTWGTLTSDEDVLTADDIVSGGSAVQHVELQVESPFDPEELVAGAQRVYHDVTVGSPSLTSDAVAMDILARLYEAALLKTGTEVGYATLGATTDFAVMIHGYVVGVMVTKAYTFPIENGYTPGEELDLLSRVFDDIQASSAYVSETDRWVKQILVVFAVDSSAAESVDAALQLIDAPTISDTVIIVVTTTGPLELVEPLY